MRMYRYTYISKLFHTYVYVCVRVCMCVTGPEKTSLIYVHLKFDLIFRVLNIPFQ